MNERKYINYHFRLSFGMILNIVFIFGFLFFFLIFSGIGKKEGFDFSKYFLASLFLFLGLLPLILFIDYFLFSFNKRVTIDEETGIIQAENYSNFRQDRIENIISVEINDFVEFRFFSFNFSYAKYFLKNDTYFIVTSFMTSTFFIPNDLSPQIFETIFPNINRKTKSPIKVKSEKEEYLEKYKDLSDKELNFIVDPQNGFRENAIRAAHETIEKRKNGV